MFLSSGWTYGAAVTAGGEEVGSSGGVEENACGVQSDGRTEAPAARQSSRAPGGGTENAREDASPPA